MRDGRDTMDEEQQQQPSEESREESALLKLQEEFHQFLQECRDGCWPYNGNSCCHR